MWRLAAESVWHDEAWSIQAIRSPFGTPDDNTPPLYYISLHLLQKLGAGENPFALRYGSVLLFLLVVALGWRIAERWYGAVAGMVAGVLLSSSPLLWEYAQEIRAYSAVPLVALGLLAGGEALLGSPQVRRVWLLVLGVELAGLYTHNLAVPLVVWLNGVVVSVFFARAHFRALGYWLASQAFLFGLYLPWLLTQSPSGTPLNTVPAFNAQLSRDLWRGYVLPVVSDPDRLSSAFITLVHVLPVLVGVSLGVLAWRGRRLRTLLIVSQVVLLPILSTLLLIRAHIDFHPRYYILAVPSTLLLLAAGVGVLPRRAKVLAMLLVLALMGSITRQSLELIANTPAYQHDDFRGMAAYYATLPADTLILIPYGYEPTLQHYYNQDIQGRFLPLPLHSSPQASIEYINAQLNAGTEMRVELLTWFQVPADERGMLPCLLHSAARAVQPGWTGYGLHSTTFFLDRHIDGQTLAFEDQFKSPLQLESVFLYGAGCLQTSWRLAAPVKDEYKTDAQLLNPFGWILAGENGLILRDDQARPKDWALGQNGAAFSFIGAPLCAPSGQYDAVLRLFTAQEISGLDVLNAAGQSLGKDLRLALTLPAAACPQDPAPALLQDNTGESPLYSGTILELEIGKGAGAAVLTLQGADWQLEQEIPTEARRWWTAFPLPSEAEGAARLWLDGEELAQYEIIRLERLFDPPAFEKPLNAPFGEIAALVGATLDLDGRVTLIWRALTTPPRRYTAFVQVLDAAGQVIAQSDQQPAGGQRPTNTWATGEYVADSHTINLNGLHYKGRVIVGLYDSLTFERLRLPDGADFVEIESVVE